MALAVPYRWGFNVNVNPDSPWFWWELLVDSYFAGDISEHKCQPLTVFHVLQ